MPVNIITDDAEDRNLTPEGSEIIDDISGATETKIIAGDIDNRHRSFRRNPFGLPPEVLIEHQIADDQGAQRRETKEKAFEKGSFNLHGERPTDQRAALRSVCIGGE